MLSCACGLAGTLSKGTSAPALGGPPGSLGSCYGELFDRCAPRQAAAPHDVACGKAMRAEQAPHDVAQVKAMRAEQALHEVARVEAMRAEQAPHDVA